MRARLQTVVETPAYLAAAKGMLSDAERADVISIAAETPRAGVALGGGIRKMRIARRDVARAAEHASCSCSRATTFRCSC